MLRPRAPTAPLRTTLFLCVVDVLVYHVAAKLGAEDVRQARKHVSCRSCRSHLLLQFAAGIEFLIGSRTGHQFVVRAAVDNLALVK